MQGLHSRGAHDICQACAEKARSTLLSEWLRSAFSMHHTCVQASISSTTLWSCTATKQSKPQPSICFRWSELAACSFCQKRTYLHMANGTIHEPRKWFRRSAAPSFSPTTTYVPTLPGDFSKKTNAKLALHMIAPWAVPASSLSPPPVSKHVVAHATPKVTHKSSTAMR